jgi:hypothetical protein
VRRLPSSAFVLAPTDASLMANPHSRRCKMWFDRRLFGVRAANRTVRRRPWLENLRLVRLLTSHAPRAAPRVPNRGSALEAPSTSSSTAIRRAQGSRSSDWPTRTKVSGRRPSRPSEAGVGGREEVGSADAALGWLYALQAAPLVEMLTDRSVVIAHRLHEDRDATRQSFSRATTERAPSSGVSCSAARASASAPAAGSKRARRLA